MQARRPTLTSRHSEDIAMRRASTGPRSAHQNGDGILTMECLVLHAWHSTTRYTHPVSGETAIKNASETNIILEKTPSTVLCFLTTSQGDIGIIYCLILLELFPVYCRRVGLSTFYMPLVRLLHKFYLAFRVSLSWRAFANWLISA